MASILPFVNFLRKKGLPKLPAVVIPFVTMLSLIVLLIIPLISFVIEQIQTLITRFPFYMKQALVALNLTYDVNQIQSYLTNQSNNFSGSAFSVTSQVFGGLFSFLMIFIVSFYLLLYYDEFKKLISKLFHKDKRATVLSTLDEINIKLGAWLRGQILLCGFIGLFSWIALKALGIPYDIPLALLSGILEVVPTLGPIISAVPAVIVALTISPSLAVTVIVAYILIQLVENNILVPKVMEKAVGLNPVAVILAVLIGANLIGISGALLAIPLVTFILVILKSLEHKHPPHPPE